MGPGEILWRLRHRVRNLWDRATWPHPAAHLARELPFYDNGPSPGLLTGGLAAQAAGPTGDDGSAAYPAEWRNHLRARADALLAHRMDLFDLKEIEVGERIPWNRDIKAGVEAPLRWAPSVDYRDPREVGDCKFVWEFNRHQHLVVLARAYALTGRKEYAQEVVTQILDWIEACPFGFGMNWRSPLELGLRLINWCLALDLIRESGLLAGAAAERLRLAAYRQMWMIQRDYSRYSSANNHLVGEAAGVFVASRFFAAFRHAKSWGERARRILIEQVERQTHPDGGNVEQAFGYHGFCLEFFLAAGLVGRATGADFPKTYWGRVKAMIGFVAAFLEGGPSPNYGDCDDGYVLDLGAQGGDLPSLLALGAVIFDQPEWAAHSNRSRDGVEEVLFWWLGEAGLKKWRALQAAKAHVPALTSRGFPDTGYYLLQSGGGGSRRSLSLWMDIAALGFGPIAAHGHADALSLGLRANGEEILIDPGTYDYFTYPEWRDYFRSTAAHNVVAVGGNQSEILGPFLWGRRASCERVYFEPTPKGGAVEGICRGLGGQGRASLRRRLEVNGEEGVIRVWDVLEIGANEEDLEQNWHFGPSVRVTPIGSHTFGFETVALRGRIDLDQQLTPTLYRGSQSPIRGWRSPRYHRKEPIDTLCGRVRGRETIELKTTIALV